MSAICKKIGCGAVATGAIAIQIFPSKSLMGFYKTTQPLTRLVMTLVTCDKHFGEIERDGINQLMPPDKLNPLIAICERSSGVVVDKTATKIVRIPLTDPDYLKLTNVKEVP